MPYLGQSPSKGDENNFKILDDISSYTLTFDGSDSSVVSAANDTITSLTHRFVQGQRVTYTDGDGSAIAGLTDATVYFIIKEDHNTIKLATSASNATNGTAVNITNVGGGSSHTLNVAFDGVNTKFKATHTTGQKTKITRSAQLVISMNGVIQQPHDTATPSTGFGFDLDGTIVFSQAPVSSDVFWAHVLTNNNVTFDISDNDIDRLTGDGSTTAFNLSKSPPDNRNVLVTIDGVVQYPNDPDGTVRAYGVVENVLTFTSAPALGTEIQVRHIGFAGSSSGSGSGGVTSVYGRTGAVVLKSTDNIIVNDASITGNATVTGNLTVNGTTTTLDTKLVEVDKIEVETESTNVAIAVTHNGSGDLIRLYDGTTQKVTIDDTGNVGIGTDTPSQLLHLAKNSQLRILLERGGAAPSEAIFANEGSYTNISNNSAGVKFSTGSTPESVMVIRSGGSVGIGTVTPSGKLDVRGDVYLGNDIYLTDDSGGYEKVEVNVNDIRFESKHLHSEFGVWTRSTSISDRRNGIEGDGNELLLYSNSTEKVRITSDGRVGINSTSPLNTLVVRESADNNPSIQLFRPSTGGDIANIIWATDQGNQASINYRGGSGSEGMQFYTGGTGSSNLRAIIDTNGLVGIGTDNPGTHLHVNSGTYDGVATFESTDAYAHLLIKDNSTHANGTYFGVEGNNFRFITHDGSTSAERLRITSDGDITFGVTASSTAVTSGNIKHISLGKDYWNGDRGHYNALRLLVYDNGLNDAYGFGISNGELEIQAQSNIGFYAGSAASNSKRDRRMYIDGGGDVTFGFNTSGSTNSTNLFNMSLGGTYHDTNGSYPKLSLWHDGTDHMGLGVSANQLDYILTSTSYDHVFYGGNAGTTEFLRIKGNSGNVGIGTETPGSKFSIMGGSIGSGAINALELKHYTTNNTGDGTAILFNGGYQNNAWAFAKISATNWTGGYGADLQVHIHPADGTQSSSVVQALSIIGDGSSGAKIRMPNAIVGIGTDNPASALDVRNASGTDPLLSLHHSEADVIGEVIRIGRVTPYHTIRYHSIKAEHSGGETSNMLAFHLHKGGSDVDEQREVLFLRGDGRVGVGVSSPTARLHVSAPYDELGAKVGAGGTGYSNAFEVYNANGALQFAVNTNDIKLGLGNRTLYYQRNLAAAINSTTEIVRFTRTHGAHSMRVSIVCSSSGFSVAKIYEITTSYNQTTAGWRVVRPISSTGRYDANFELLINVTNTQTDLKLRKIDYATYGGNCDISINYTGSYAQAVTVTNKSATGTDTTAHDVFEEGFGLYDVNNGQTALTLPKYHPSFMVHPSTDAQTADGFVTYTSVSYNNGGHYNTSGGNAGKFIAPVFGRYFFAANYVAGAGSENCFVQFYINGSLSNKGRHYSGGGNAWGSGSPYMSCDLSGTCVQLSKDDYVQLKLQATNGGGEGQAAYMRYFGYLIG